LRRTLILFLSLLTGILVIWLSLKLNSQIRSNVVLQILNTVPVSELVVLTEEQVTFVNQDQSGFWLGPRTGQASLTVKLAWSMDLSEVQPSDIVVSGRQVTVRLPPVRVFEVIPDFASWTYYGQKSGLYWIIDAIQGRTIRDDLFAETGTVLDSMRYRDGSVHRPDIVRRLNEKLTTLLAGSDLVVILL